MKKILYTLILSQILVPNLVSQNLESLESQRTILINQRNDINHQIDSLNTEIKNLQTDQNVDKSDLDPNKYYAVTETTVSYDLGDYNFKNIPKGVIVEVISYKGLDKYLIVPRNTNRPGYKTETGLSKIGELDFTTLKEKKSTTTSNTTTANKEKAKNKVCKFILDQYDPFDKKHHYLTNYTEVLKKSEDKWSKSLKMFFGKKGTDAYIKISAGSVECITSSSTAELILDNDKKLKFYHKYDIDCGDNIMITANLTNSEIQDLKNHSIIAAKIIGSEFYANFLTPISNSKEDIRFQLDCLNL